MSTGLRTTFWIHAIVAVIFSLGYLFAQNFMADFFQIEAYDPTILALYGAAVLALGLSSVLAALADRWEEVRIIVEIEVMFTVLSVVICLYAVFFAGAPAVLWVGVALFAVLFLLFGYFYLRERSAHGVSSGTPALR